MIPEERGAEMVRDMIFQSRPLTAQSVRDRFEHIDDPIIQHHVAALIDALKAEDLIEKPTSVKVTVLVETAHGDGYTTCDTARASTTLGEGGDVLTAARAIFAIALQSLE